MTYIKNLFLSVLPVIKYMVFSYLVIFIAYVFYLLLGTNDANYFVINYGSYILILYNIIYIFYLRRKNIILCKKTKPILPFIMLGISFACFCNMIILTINKNQVIDVNIYVLIFSSALIGPIAEENIFRHLLVKNIEKFNNKILTIIIASLIFAVMHDGIINIIYTFILGIILNIIYIKNKNLLYPIIVHCSANFITLFLTVYDKNILIISFILLAMSFFIVKRDYLLR